MITDLDKNLAASLRQGSTPSTLESHDIDSDDNFAYINTVEEEYDYWMSEYNSFGGKKKERALFFANLLKHIKHDFDNNRSSKLSDLYEVADKIQDYLDEIWRQDQHMSYSEPRMKNLISILIDQIVTLLQTKFLSKNIITENGNDAIPKIRSAMEICENVISSVQTLTTKIWPNWNNNPWKGKSFESKLLNNFNARLKAILEIRISHDLLLKLNNHEEPTNESHLVVFNSINPLDCTTYNDHHWEV